MDVSYYLQEVERLERDFKKMRNEHMRTGALDNERQRKATDAETLFKESVKACERDIMKSHETGTVKEENGNGYDKVSNSYFFEIKRKKFLQEIPTSQLLDNNVSQNAQNHGTLNNG